MASGRNRAISSNELRTDPNMRPRYKKSDILAPKSASPPRGLILTPPQTESLMQRFGDKSATDAFQAERLLPPFEE